MTMLKKHVWIVKVAEYMDNHELWQENLVNCLVDILSRDDEYAKYTSLACLL